MYIILCPLLNTVTVNPSLGFVQVHCPDCFHPIAMVKCRVVLLRNMRLDIVLNLHTPKYFSSLLTSLVPSVLLCLFYFVAFVSKCKSAFFIKQISISSIYIYIYIHTYIYIYIYEGCPESKDTKVLNVQRF
jgi:hypothetical protein